MKCLVIMPFKAEFDAIFKCVKAAAKRAATKPRLDCYWLKDIQAAGPITDDIVAGIQDSKFCIADVTGNNPNVMWETGYAMALGKPIILIGQRVESPPFDLRTHRLIAYRDDNLQALSKNLVSAIRQTVTRCAATRPPNRPGDLFWLGHDLARAIRLAMFERNAVAGSSHHQRTELDRHLLQILFHLEQIEIDAPDARKLVVKALSANKQSLSDEEWKKLVAELATTKNELGNIVSESQPDFRAYASIQENERYLQEAQDLVRTAKKRK
ncbi:MAG: hypothetical protein HY289_15370 [Planctomycetes bacterium]|nr:hypothetical protein [Planctomycetota bacterium]